MHLVENAGCNPDYPDTLLKKGTKEDADGWDAKSKSWAHMILHLPHAEGDFGVTFNDVTKDVELRDSSSWSSSLVLD